MSEQLTSALNLAMLKHRKHKKGDEMREKQYQQVLSRLDQAEERIAHLETAAETLVVENERLKNIIQAVGEDIITGEQFADVEYCICAGENFCGICQAKTFVEEHEKAKEERA